MENNQRDFAYENVMQLDDSQTSSRKFIANVFLWMFIALGLSAFTAYWFAHDNSLLSTLMDVTTHQRTGLGTIVMFAPLAFILVMSFGINRISTPVLIFLFLAFSAVMGMSLSFIFLAYTSASIFGVFVTASVVFGVMAIGGYVTNKDLTSFGGLMVMGLVGIIIASFANMFLRSEGLDKAITYISVAVFVGLTAYDVQKLKRIGAGLEYGSAAAGKMAIMGALTLYLDFINLFLSLLRLFGRRR